MNQSNSLRKLCALEFARALIAQLVLEAGFPADFD